MAFLRRIERGSTGARALLGVERGCTGAGALLAGDLETGGARESGGVGVELRVGVVVRVRVRMRVRVVGSVLPVLAMFTLLAVAVVAVFSMLPMLAVFAMAMLPTMLLHLPTRLDLRDSHVLPALGREPLEEGLIGNNVGDLGRLAGFVPLDPSLLHSLSIRRSSDNDLDVCSLRGARVIDIVPRGGATLAFRAPVAASGNIPGGGGGVGLSGGRC